MVAFGGNVLTPSHAGETPLDAAINKGHVNVIRELVDQGVNINTPSPNGSIPILTAVRSGRVDVIRTVVTSGADLNTPLEDEATPVIIAAQEGHADVIKLLYKLGADMKPKSQYSVSKWAEDGKHIDALEIIEKILNKLTRECQWCGCSSKRLKMCSKCEKVWYCSRECQVQDFKKHKKECTSSSTTSSSTSTTSSTTISISSVEPPTVK